MSFLSDIPLHITVGLAAAALGLILGVVMQRTQFCTMAAIAEAVVVSRFTHLRAWVLAAAIALLGTQGLIQFTDIAISESIYLGTPLFWLGAIGGGLIFGYGMVLASGCALRSFVNAGSGDLRALVALATTGLFAYMTMRGLIGPAQQWLREVGSNDIGGLGILAQFDFQASGTARLVLVAAIALPALYFCLSRDLLRSPRHLVAALTLGVAVPAAWLVTGVLGFDDFEPTPLSGLSFVQPAADSMMYVMTYTGSQLSFGVALAAGLLVGAAGSAFVGGTRSLTGFKSEGDTPRYFLGGAMMGIGGVLAGGCTIGQGVTGIATLSIGSFIAIAAIGAGAVLGVLRRERVTRSRQLEQSTDSLAPAGAAVLATEFNACGN